MLSEEDNERLFARCRDRKASFNGQRWAKGSPAVVVSLSDRHAYTRTRVCTHPPTHPPTCPPLLRAGTVTFEQWVAVMLETAEAEVKEKNFFGLF